MDFWGSIKIYVFDVDLGGSLYKLFNAFFSTNLAVKVHYNFQWQGMLHKLLVEISLFCWKTESY